MRKLLCSAPPLLAAAMLLLLPTAAARAGEIPASTLQAVVVTTPDWSAPEATLQVYERRDGLSAWLPVGVRFPAITGKQGLAWGRGLHPAPGAATSQKQEGDGKAPAGIFRLGTAFGYDPGAALPRISLAYRQMGQQSRCVDDAASVHYNRLIEEGSVAKDWNSSEDMRRSDGQYRLGVVVDHNADPVAPGCGSCIFFHIWKGASLGTSGCTAVSDSDMEAILRMLRPETKPVLIQLPRGEYERLRVPWGLP